MFNDNDNTSTSSAQAFPMAMESGEVVKRTRLVEVARVRLEAGTGCVACHVPKGMYHTCQSLKSGSVIIEFKATRYDKVKSEEVFENLTPSLSEREGA